MRLAFPVAIVGRPPSAGAFLSVPAQSSMRARPGPTPPFHAGRDADFLSRTLAADVAEGTKEQPVKDREPGATFACSNERARWPSRRCMKSIASDFAADRAARKRKRSERSFQWRRGAAGAPVSTNNSRTKAVTAQLFSAARAVIHPSDFVSTAPKGRRY